MEISQPAFPISSSVTRAMAAAGAFAVAGASAVVWYFDPTKANFLPVCPLYAMTGFACPGCGLTRGFHALFHGDILTALDYNALIPGFSVVVGFLFIALVSFAVRGRGFGISMLSPKLLTGILVVLLVFGVVRNIPAYPFSVLYP